LMNRSYTIILMRLSCWMLFSLTMTGNMAISETSPPTLHLKAGPHRIEVEVAAAPALRKLGLMNRYFLPADHGMLFVFPESKVHCMWMHNTKIPLSAAFIDEQGRIINIVDMEPDTDDCHCAASSAQFVIEMRSGWFREKGIAPGTYINGIDKAPIGQ
jgi:uncharacterized protein